MKRAKAIARATVTVEVQLTDTWGADCPLGQVNKQARDGVAGLFQALADPGTSISRVAHIRSQLRLVGEPKVSVIVVEEET